MIDGINDAREYDKKIQELLIHKNLLIESQLASNDAENIMKAQSYIQSLQKDKEKGLRAFLFDPFDSSNHGGYKEVRRKLPMSVISRVSRTPFVSSIINTRIFQVLNYMKFTDDESKEGYTIRRKKSLFSEENKKKTVSKEDRKKIENIVEFLENGGLKKKWDMTDDLPDFIRKILRDSLSYDQLSAEMERTLSNKLVGFTAIDASTVVLLETIDKRFQKQTEEKYQKVLGYYPRYAQVWNGNIVNDPYTNQPVVYYPWELMYEQRNRTTLINDNGYGTSEIEILSDILTWILWGFQYNGNFFKQGSNPKGFLNLKDKGANIDVINDFRQTWRQLAAGNNNCIHGDTNIITADGQVKIGDLFLEDKEDKYYQIWDGEEFIDGRVYVSGKKQVTSMKLNNGIEIKCSFEHRFKVIDETTGEPIWKERKDIVLGDYVLVNKNPVISESSVLTFRDEIVEPDLFEVLGWAIGDGWFGENIPRKRRMSLFYHQSKERDILERHLSILRKYGINCQKDERFYSEQEKQDLISRNNFKSVADLTLKISIFDADFMDMLYTVGFKSSKEGKQIPKFLFSYFSEHKCAFLRGFFSADGHVSAGRFIQMSITSDVLREQTKQLLLSEGIRCNLFEGNIRRNTHWGDLKAGYLLLVKDNKEYFEKIGMLQDHKQYIPNKSNSYNTKDSIHPATAKLIINLVRENCKVNGIKRSKRDIAFCSEVAYGQNVCLTTLIDFAAKLNCPLPSFITNYSLSKVVELTEFDEFVEMYDVEMYDEKHQFMANGILTHNSHKIPIFGGIDLEWIDLQGKNTDMEWQRWIELLIIVGCSVYNIDPTELGYSFNGQSNIFSQEGQHERLEHSKQKGLNPILTFVQKILTKNIVSELEPGFEFVCCGVDKENESVAVDIDKKKTDAGFVSFESMFEKYSGRKYDENKDTILNPIFMQQQQMKMMGGDQSNQAVDEQNNENPFSQYEAGEQVYKALKENPFDKMISEYLNPK